MLNRLTRTLLALLFTVCMYSACQSHGEEPIELSKDSCHHCKMLIVNGRYGGELITSRSKVYKFDSLDCLLSFYKAHRSEIQKVLVLNFANPQSFLAAGEARFGVLESRDSPMGTKLIALPVSVSDTSALPPGISSDLRTWEELQKAAP